MPTPQPPEASPNPGIAGMTPDQLVAAIAQGNFQAQVMGQGALVSYLDSFFAFGCGMLLILWLPFLLKRPAAGAPVHLD